MTGSSYDYANRDGIRPVSWNDMHGLCKALALAIEPYDPELILPIARGGNYPGTLLAHLLRTEVYSIRLTRRFNDEVVRQQPQWLVEPPATVAGRRVLVVDEISSSGATLRAAAERARELGASAVRSAVLYAHTWGTEMPDYIGVITDALLLNPWDREILVDGTFRFHPEYEQALTDQGLDADSSLLVPATPFTIAKEAD